MSYVPLHVHSFYSLCTGTSSPERILDAVEKYSLPAVALTDSANLYAAVGFYQAARERGVKPIVGASVPTRHGWAVVLARNFAGYENLCRLVTLARLGARPGEIEHEDSQGLADHDGTRGRSVSKVVYPIDVDAFAERQDGLYILTASGSLVQALAARVQRACLAVELIRPNRNINRERDLLELAERFGLRVVGTTAATMLSPSEIRLHRLLVAVRENELVTSLPRARLSLPGHFLCSAELFAHRFRDIPRAIEATVEVAETCELELTLGRPLFPRYPLEDGEAAQSRLARLAEEGLARCYPSRPRKAVERLRYELDVIHRLGFDDYFLVVADILRYARSRGIPSVGRGSGASSIVSYLLGITTVDPLRYNIQFERFLNLSRSDCPDIDVDLCWHRRDQVIEYVFKKYGAGHTAMISTHNTFRWRGAFREVARAYGLACDDIARLVDHVGGDMNERPGCILARAGGRIDVDPSRLGRVLQHARGIVGFPHHISVHCGGVVISPKAIDTCLALQRAAKGVVVTQFEMNAVEDIGLVKIDLLGNRALSTMDETCRIVSSERGERLRPEDIPGHDEATFEMLRDGLTVGVNQLESPAMRNLLKMCEPRQVEDIIAALALVRPGAAGAGMKEEYIRRRRGLSPVVYPHPAVQEVLHDSLGIMLYEDDTMVVASRLAGLSFDEGDRFRKALKKAKDGEEMARLKAWFFRRCRKNRVLPRVIEGIWRQMEKFREYSFCKSHACGYGQMAYLCAYLKRHYPAAFAVAVLNHHAGMYALAVHVEEAKRVGARVLLPCVNRSMAQFTVESGAIRIGLSQVKGLSQGTIGQIVDERGRHGDYGSLSDFIQRVDISHPEAESLVLCGAFDFTGRKRPELVWELHRTLEGERRMRAYPRLFRDGVQVMKVPRLPDFTPAERLQHELAILDVSAGPHPLSLLRMNLPRVRIDDSRALALHVGKRLRLYGMLDAMRTVRNRNGQLMQFLTFEDEFGLWEATLFADVYERFAGMIGAWGPYLIEGRVEEQYGAITMNVRHIALAGMGRAAVGTPRIPARESLAARGEI